MTDCLGRRCEVFNAYQDNKISEQRMEELCQTCIITANLKRNDEGY